MQEQAEKQALIVLPGLTADRRKRHSMQRFFAEHSPYAVFVANIPDRRGLHACARWLSDYLEQVVRPARYDAVQVLAYISGGVLLRELSRVHVVTNLASVVYVRSPIQEFTLRTLRARYGRLWLWILRGRLALDLVSADLADLPFPSAGCAQGLIVETGVSQLARSMGVGPELVPVHAWDPESLLPAADDVIRVPESHDEVYTSEDLLLAVLRFFRLGRFREPWTEAVGGEG